MVVIKKDVLSASEKIEDELVPHKYRVKAPDLVWSSKTVTWHGQDLTVLCQEFIKAVNKGDPTQANGIAIELLVSGYISKIWDSIWSVMMLKGIGLAIPDLWGMFLSEYKALNTIRNRLNRLGRPWDIANHQEYRNHITQCISILCLVIKSGQTHVVPVYSLQQGETYLMPQGGAVGAVSEGGSPGPKGHNGPGDSVPDSHARSVAQEYILLTKTADSPVLEMQELHFNLSRLLQAINKANTKSLGSKHKACGNSSINGVEPEVLGSGVGNKIDTLAEIFFWIYEIVTMREPDLNLRKDFQYYMPRLKPDKAEWVCKPPNILWNYLFIRTANRDWKHLAALMEIFTLCYKRKDDLTCSAILYNLLFLLNRDQNDAPTLPTLHLYDSPIVIRTVLGINRAFLLLKEEKVRG